jgi:hypothetical protein
LYQPPTPLIPLTIFFDVGIALKVEEAGAKKKKSKK